LSQSTPFQFALSDQPSEPGPTLSQTTVPAPVTVVGVMEEPIGTVAPAPTLSVVVVIVPSPSKASVPAPVT